MVDLASPRPDDIVQSDLGPGFYIRAFEATSRDETSYVTGHVHVAKGQISCMSGFARADAKTNFFFFVAGCL